MPFKFEVFDSSGTLVSGGNCTIAANSTSGSNTGAAITLTAGQRYSVKATNGAGTTNFPGGDTAWWALGG